MMITIKANLQWDGNLPSRVFCNSDGPQIENERKQKDKHIIKLKKKTGQYECDGDINRINRTNNSSKKLGKSVKE